MEDDLILPATEQAGIEGAMLVSATVSHVIYEVDGQYDQSRTISSVNAPNNSQGVIEMMSLKGRQLLEAARQMIPPMLPSFHKGQMGRIAVIGGSEDYTGAPYFSAMASGRLGADMTHVICEPQAALVIKSYSPNLMVHPYMRQSQHVKPGETADGPADRIIEMLSRLHVLVVGPGLGRDPLMQEICMKVVKEARKRNMPLVIDADGLYMVESHPELVKGYKLCILTPNVVEFGRLLKSQGIDPPVKNEDQTEICSKLARAFGGLTIIQKGEVDRISDGVFNFVGDLQGGLKRSGGQGDTLTGCVGTFLCWRKAFLDKIWDHVDDPAEEELMTLAAFAGSSVTRECSRLAFEKKGRSLMASDLTDEVAQSSTNLFRGTGP